MRPGGAHAPTRSPDSAGRSPERCPACPPFLGQRPSIQAEAQPLDDAGIRPDRKNSPRHFRRPPEHPFTASQRRYTTILLGGLSPRHDRLVEAAVQSLGYRCKALPNVSLDSYTTGKLYGNNGLCNPSYFTVGNLVKYLQDLEAQGMSRREIIDTHVFVTAGSCGTRRAR